MHFTCWSCVLNLQTFTVSHLMTHAGRGVYPYIPMATNAPWSIFFVGDVGEWTKSYLSMYLVYIVFLPFSQKIFSLARLRFILNLQIQYVLPTPFIYIFSFFWCHYPWLPASEVHWKRAQNCTKLRIKCPKIVSGVEWLGVRHGGKGAGESWELGEAPWLLGEIDAPACR